MKAKEAKAILRRNHICPVHGTAMGYSVNGYYCSECDKIQRMSELAKIAEAKKVLGLT